MSRSCVLMDLGLVEYREAWELQRYLVGKRLENSLPDVLLLLEHPPVYTVGRRGTTSGLEGLGIPVHEVERGGEVTYHGSGQLVGYPIMALSRGKLDVKGYVADVEDVLILTVASFGIEGERGPHSGLWVGPKKLASIGVAVKHYVTYHGFALNVNVDLLPFRRIRPCGIQGTRITSLKEILGREVPMDEVKASLIQSFSEVFGAELLSSEEFPGLERVLEGLLPAEMS
ncbi:MAG: lipoyl(octanoyl) transferase LipB [Candidatus Thermoplasmatota archaeon]|nr:lipoyl(octanoyl) transferase LipB [Candidatus Thermoplasmatota archaeon]